MLLTPPGSGSSALGLPAGFTLDLASRVARQGAAFGVRRAVEDAFRPAGEDGGAGGGRYTARSRSSRWGQRGWAGVQGREGVRSRRGRGWGSRYMAARGWGWGGPGAGDRRQLQVGGGIKLGPGRAVATGCMPWWLQKFLCSCRWGPQGLAGANR